MTFSIIIPVFKAELFLEKSIRSILEQTYSHFELILIDDGSPDNSGIICDFFESIDNRVKVIHQKNKGPSYARNQGLSIAQGKYILFMDSDDYMQKDALKKVVKSISDYPKCGLYTLAYNKEFMNGKKEFQSINHSLINIPLNKNEYYRVISENNQTFWAPWQNVFSKEIIDSHNILFDVKLKCAEDCDFYMQYIEKNDSNVCFLDFPLINYRVDNPSSITNNITKEILIDQLYVFNKYFYHFSEKTRGSENIKILFANKFANTISLVGLLDKKSNLELNQYIKKHSEILKHTKGIKYIISKFIWMLFGYFHGSKIIHYIRKIIK